MMTIIMMMLVIGMMIMMKINFFKLYDGYKNQKAQKASIKEKLLPIAWYLSRYCDWCVPEYEKKETEKLWR